MFKIWIVKKKKMNVKQHKLLNSVTEYNILIDDTRLKK